MKKIIFSYFLLAIPFFSINTIYAQNTIFDWAVKVGGVNSDYGYSITVDASGNVYTTGTFQGTADFDPGAGIFNLTSAGMNDIFITKMDADGNFVWAKNIGATGDDQGRSITLDAVGNVYTTGSFRGTVDFDPGTGINNLTAVSDDIFISKLDTDGNFVWGKRMGGTSSEVGYSIAVDATGSIYITGSFSGTVDFDPGVGIFNLTTNIFTDIFISKLDANGNFIWAKNIGAADNDEGRTIKVDDSENIYITGYFSGTVDFDPGIGINNLTSAGAEDIFILKLDASGNFLWAKSIGGIGFDVESDIALDASGNVYTTGAFQGTVDFDPGMGTYNQTSVGIVDIFILKFDTNGNFIWVKTMGAAGFDSGQSISLDAAGNIYTTGTFSGTADFDPGVGIYNRTSSGSNDIFILKLNANGNFVWVKTTGGTGYDFGRSITLDTFGNIYTTGGFETTVDFDPEVGVTNLTSTGNADMFIMKLQSCQPVYGTDVVSSCGSYTWIDGIEYATSTNTPTFTLTSASNCDSIITLNLTIGDLISPVVNTVTLSDVTGLCSVSSLTAPTATDNCVGTITGTHNATLPITTQGTTVVTWTYDDGNGNTSTQTQNVIISDNTTPVANTTSLADVTGQCSVASLTAPTATDNCAGTITGTTTTTFPITTSGTTVVTWTYNDGNGNTSTQTQNVIIDDNIAPVANTANLADVTGQCSVTAITAPTATDNCAGTITGTHNATLPITTQGTTVVTWTYDDGNGNTSTQTQNVIVTVPVATTTLSGLTITATTSGATYQWIDCGNGHSPITGATSQSYTATANGSYAVIVTQNGCSATSTCVTVNSVGIESLEQNGWNVYPNPNNGVFTITSTTEFNNSTIEVYSTLGQLLYSSVHSGDKVVIDLNEQPTGVYILKVNNQQSLIIIKL